MYNSREHARFNKNQGSVSISASTTTELPQSLPPSFQFREFFALPSFVILNANLKLIKTIAEIV